MSTAYLFGVASLGRIATWICPSEIYFLKALLRCQNYKLNLKVCFNNNGGGGDGGSGGGGGRPAFFDMQGIPARGNASKNNFGLVVAEFYQSAKVYYLSNIFLHKQHFSI